jgi:hypothetical protein
MGQKHENQYPLPNSMNVFKRKGGRERRCARNRNSARSERTAGNGRAWRKKRERFAGLARPSAPPGFSAMSKPAEAFDFRKPVAHDAAARRAFHTAVQRQLRQVAHALGLTRSQYKLRLTDGGSALSGAITLHSDSLYIQASQPSGRINAGILFRTCHGRDDPTGGENHYASLELLNRPEDLARLIKRVCDV